MRHIPFFSALVLGLSILFNTACKQSNLETVEDTDEKGFLLRWQRDKQTFVKEGLYQRFYPGGVLAEEAHYVRDTIDGEHKYFYQNGKPESVERYRMGVYHGKYQKYDQQGRLMLEQDFVNGVMQGFSLGYYPSGALKEKYTMKDNEENGPFQEYHENGTLKTEGTYGPVKDGGTAEQGELREYDDAGRLIRIADCKDGTCLSTWKAE